MAQPWVPIANGFDNIGRPVSVLNSGTVNDDEQHLTQRIGDDVALAALDLLACIIAANPTGLGGFDGLAIDNTSCRRGFAVLQFARAHNQNMIDRLP